MNIWFKLAIALAVYGTIVALILYLLAWLGEGAETWDRTIADHFDQKDDI